jgi:RNA polymerase sigma-70 factor (ECF subfamily)
MEAANLYLLAIDRLASEPQRSLPDEGALLRRAQSGDAGAVAALIQAYRPRIYCFALSQLRLREDAEDVTQETFVRMVRMLATYQGRGQFRAWLYRIAANLCRDQQRRHSRHHERRVEGAELPEAIAPGDMQEEVSRDLTLAAAVARLPDKYREVITLYWLEQLSPAEIAEVLDRSVNAVRVQLWRGRARLVRELGDWLD